MTPDELDAACHEAHAQLQAANAYEHGCSAGTEGFRKMHGAIAFVAVEFWAAEVDRLTALQHVLRPGAPN